MSLSCVRRVLALAAALVVLLTAGCSASSQTDKLSHLASGHTIGLRSGMSITVPEHATALLSRKAGRKRETNDSALETDTAESVWITQAPGDQLHNVRINSFWSGDNVLMHHVARWKLLAASSNHEVEVRWDAHHPVSSIAVVTRVRGRLTGILGDFAIRAPSRRAALGQMRSLWHKLSVEGVPIPNGF